MVKRCRKRKYTKKIKKGGMLSPEMFAEYTLPYSHEKDKLEKVKLKNLKNAEKALEKEKKKIKLKKEKKKKKIKQIEQIKHYENLEDEVRQFIKSEYKKPDDSDDSFESVEEAKQYTPFKPIAHIGKSVSFPEPPSTPRSSTSRVKKPPLSPVQSDGDLDRFSSAETGESPPVSPVSPVQSDGDLDRFSSAETGESPPVSPVSPVQSDSDNDDSNMQLSPPDIGPPTLCHSFNTTRIYKFNGAPSMTIYVNAGGLQLKERLISVNITLEIKPGSPQDKWMVSIIGKNYLKTMHDTILEGKKENPNIHSTLEGNILSFGVENTNYRLTDSTRVSKIKKPDPGTNEFCEVVMVDEYEKTITPIIDIIKNLQEKVKKGIHWTIRPSFNEPELYILYRENTPFSRRGQSCNLPCIQVGFRAFNIYGAPGFAQPAKTYILKTQEDRGISSHGAKKLRKKQRTKRKPKRKPRKSPSKKKPRKSSPEEKPRKNPSKKKPRKSSSKTKKKKGSKKKNTKSFK